jgi:hypothetical protein
MFGIPATGDSDVVTSLIGVNQQITSIFESNTINGDHSSVITDFDERIVAIEGLADNGSENRIKKHLERYDEIASSQLFINDSPSGKGVLADDITEIQRIRKLIADSMGLWLVGGSWSDQVEQTWFPVESPGLGDR